MAQLFTFGTCFIAVALFKAAALAALLNLAGCGTTVETPPTGSSSGAAGNGEPEGDGGVTPAQCRAATDLDCPGPLVWTCKKFEAEGQSLTVTVCDGPPPARCELLYACQQGEEVLNLWCCP